MYFNHKSLGSKKGISIAFLGQDGAGKSTVTNQICEWLNWKIEAQKFYLGSGDHYHSIFKSMKRLFQSNNSLSKAIWALLNIVDLTILSCHNRKIVKTVNKYVSKGGIALFDRYPQIQFQGINDGPKIRINYVDKTKNSLLKKVMNIFAKIEERNINLIAMQEPDIIIKLLLSPEESIKRKPEENIDNVREKHNIIKSLTFANSKVYEINAEVDYGEEILQIKRIIWTEILEKSKSTRGNGYVGKK